MKVLLVYGTNSGGTLKAAELIADVLRAKKATVTITRADQAEPGQLGKADLVIFGSCTWEAYEDGKRLDGQLQHHMREFAKRLDGRTFPKTRFAVYGLGDPLYTKQCAAVDRLEELVHGLKGELIAPSPRILGYYFNLPENEARVRDWAESLPLA